MKRGVNTILGTAKAQDDENYQFSRHFIPVYKSSQDDGATSSPASSVPVEASPNTNQADKPWLIVGRGKDFTLDAFSCGNCGGDIAHCCRYLGMSKGQCPHCETKSIFFSQSQMDASGNINGQVFFQVLCERMRPEVRDMFDFMNGHLDELEFMMFIDDIYLAFNSENTK